MCVTRVLQGQVRGWERGPQKLYLTLTREDTSTAWGFSVNGGQDILENGGFWSGVVTRRHERGLWLNVGNVRDEAPANKAGLKKNDFISRINGRIVFHMEPEDVQRLIKNSGKVLYLDIERNDMKNLLYNNGLHQYSYNFLFNENLAEKPSFIY